MKLFTGITEIRNINMFHYRDALSGKKELTEFIEEFKDYLDWKFISRYRCFNSEFLIKYNDIMDLNLALSNPFISNETKLSCSTHILRKQLCALN